MHTVYTSNSVNFQYFFGFLDETFLQLNHEMVSFQDIKVWNIDKLSC